MSDQRRFYGVTEVLILSTPGSIYVRHSNDLGVVVDCEDVVSFQVCSDGTLCIRDNLKSRGDRIVQTAVGNGVSQFSNITGSNITISGVEATVNEGSADEYYGLSMYGIDPVVVITVRHGMKVTIEQLAKGHTIVLDH